MQISDWINLLFRIVIFLVTVLPLCNAWLKKYLSDEQQKIILDAVRAAEQTVLTNPEKKEYVMNLVLTELEKFGVKATAEDIDTAVEAAVYFVKKEKKENKTN